MTNNMLKSTSMIALIGVFSSSLLNASAISNLVLLPQPHLLSNNILLAYNATTDVFSATGTSVSVGNGYFLLPLNGTFQLLATIDGTGFLTSGTLTVTDESMNEIFALSLTQFGFGIPATGQRLNFLGNILRVGDNGYDFLPSCCGSGTRDLLGIKIATSGVPLLDLSSDFMGDGISFADVGLRVVPEPCQWLLTASGFVLFGMFNLLKSRGHCIVK